MTTLFVLFLLVFPKGGFTIAEIPITWGYMLLGGASLLRLCRKPISINRSRLHALLLLAPFQAVTLLMLAIRGAEEASTLIPFLVTFFVLPPIFYLFLSEAIGELDTSHLLSLIRRGIMAVALYGLFLFFYRIYAGEFIGIPFLTINGVNLELLDDKCNLRSGISKLISTYNNGNIYGICLILLLPLYDYQEKRYWRRLLVKLSLLLTLSRTVWFGLFIHELLFHCFVRRKILRWLVTTGLFICLIAIVLAQLSLPWDFVWDRELGGRAEQLSALFELPLWPTEPFHNISEITYLGILSSFGLFGLITFLLAITAPLLLSHASPRTPLITCIRCGLCNYLLLSCSDGAILLIPVMAFYWFLSSWLLRSG